MSRHYDEAIEQLRQTIDMDPNFQWAHRNLAWAYEQKKMYGAAITELQKVRVLSNGEAGLYALGHAYAVAGKKNEALEIIEQLHTRSKSKFVAASSFAVVYAGLGEKDQALDWLEKSVNERDPAMTNLKVEPRFDNLRSDPRFVDLLRRMKLVA